VIPANELFVERLNQLAIGVEQADRLDVLPVALALRQLLLDAEPLVHQLNRPPVALRLRFTVNKEANTPGVAEPVFSFPGLAMDPNTFVSVAGTEELKLDEFLTYPVVKADSGDVTVHDLIDYLCHKAGAVHYVADRSREETVVRQLDSYGWPLVASAVMGVVRVVLVGLTPLRDAVWRPPAGIPLFGAYRSLPGAWIWVRGDGTYRRTDLNYSLAAGFTFAAAFKLGADQEPGDHCLYELGTPNRAATRFSLIQLSPSGFGCRFSIDDANVLRVDLPASDVQTLQQSGAVLVAELVVEPGSTKLVLSLNRQKVGSAVANIGIQSREVTLQTLGASLEGTKFCTGAIGELLLIERGLTSSEREAVTRYLRMTLRSSVPS
jgi:hypothetical protein